VSPEAVQKEKIVRKEKRKLKSPKKRK